MLDKPGDFKLKICGKEWNIIFKRKDEDPSFKSGSCDGWCDQTIRCIAVMVPEDPQDNPQANVDSCVLMEQILRHELIHAMLHESGIGSWKQDELLVDWFALKADDLANLFSIVTEEMDAYKNC